MLVRHQEHKHREGIRAALSDFIAGTSTHACLAELSRSLSPGPAWCRTISWNSYCLSAPPWDERHVEFGPAGRSLGSTFP